MELAVDAPVATTGVLPVAVQVAMKPVAVPAVVLVAALVNATVICPTPAVTLFTVGTPGLVVVVTPGTTTAEADARLEPMAFLACALQV